MQQVQKTIKYARVAALVLRRGQQQAVTLLLAGIVLFAFLYVYFLGSAVTHAVVRKEVQQDIAQTSSRIAELEVEYLRRKDAVTTEVAAEMGFTRIAQKDFVERTRYQANAQLQ